MSQAMKSINAAMGAKEAAVPQIGLGKLPFANFLPAILPLVGAFLVLAARIKFGASVAPADGTLVVLALLCYIFAAAALVTNFWAPIRFLQRLGLWTASLGFFFNLSGWLVRWVAAGERENWIRITDRYWQYRSSATFRLRIFTTCRSRSRSARHSRLCWSATVRTRVSSARSRFR